MSESAASTDWTFQVVLMAMALLSMGTLWLAGRRGSPLLAIAGRWFRWLFFAAFLAAVVNTFVLPQHSLLLLFIAAVLLWFFFETAYNWLAINALSKSNLPLFPRYEENHRGDEWPSQHHFIELKNWIRQQGLQRRQALIAQISDQVLLRISSYENAEKTIRLNVYFLPFSGGNTVACIAFQSDLSSGERILTDNLFLPFAGFYPEAWLVERRPLCRTASALFQRHKARLDAHGKECKVLLRTPLEQTNSDQRKVENLNRELGFLHDLAVEPELGRLTPAGKARVWQEVWLLAYLGKAFRYC
jgi:hypothetical protein